MENKEEIKKEEAKMEEEIKKEETNEEEKDEDKKKQEEQKISKDSKDLEDDISQDAKKEQIEELNNKLLRLQADFINYKNRVEKEKESLYTSATEDIILQLLPILDNFERALDNMEKDNANYEGINMIYKQFIDVLTKNGLKEIECKGKTFDPKFHHAVFMEETEGEDELTILEVLQKGYMLKDKVIRPSMVKVAK